MHTGANPYPQDVSQHSHVGPPCQVQAPHLACTHLNIQAFCAVWRRKQGCLTYMFDQELAPVSPRHGDSPVGAESPGSDGESQLETLGPAPGRQRASGNSRRTKVARRVHTGVSGTHTHSHNIHVHSQHRCTPLSVKKPVCQLCLLEGPNRSRSDEPPTGQTWDNLGSKSNGYNES